jgi:hypothetical protein
MPTPQTLNVLMNVTGSDDDLLADASAAPGGAAVQRYLLHDASSQLAEARRQFQSAQESSTFRYYPEFNQALATNHISAPASPQSSGLKRR